MPSAVSAITIPTTDDSQPLRIYLPLTTVQRAAISDILRSSDPFAIAVTEGGYRTVPVEWVLLPSLGGSTDNLAQRSDSISESDSDSSSVLSSSISDDDDIDTLDEPTYHRFEVRYLLVFNNRSSRADDMRI